MVTDPRLGPRFIARFDHDEVDADWEPRCRTPIRQAVLQQPADRRAKVAALAMTERLLRQTEVAAPSPADLDDHEHRWRARVDRDEVDLVATDTHVPRENRPARDGQTMRDGHLG